jgi:hypothetical protein
MPNSPQYSVLQDREMAEQLKTDSSPDLNTKGYDYSTSVPSPYIGKFKQLTGILNADPTSIDKEETKRRLTSYTNELRDKFKDLQDRPFELNRTLQDSISNAYIDDVIGREKNLKDLAPKILKDFGTNANANINFMKHANPEYSGVTLFPNNMSPLAYKKDSDIFIDPRSPSPESTLFHELRHHYDYENNQIPENKLEETQKKLTETQISNPFELSKAMGSYEHHTPIGDDKEDAMLMYPFEKIGYKPKNIFEKLKQKIGIK